MFLLFVVRGKLKNSLSYPEMAKAIEKNFFSMAFFMTSFIVFAQITLINCEKSTFLVV